MQLEPNLSLDQVKDLLAAKTAPRVTEQSIKSRIQNVSYMVVDTTTVCFIEMVNGFRFMGTSTPASAENFDAQIGERYAYDSAFRQIWTHEGYLLREALHLLKGPEPAPITSEADAVAAANQNAAAQG